MKHLHRQSAFTLIELVMTILLVGIVAIYAAPRLGALSSYNLTSATDELIEVIRFAQETSMVRADSGFQVTSGGADKYHVYEYLYTSSSSQEVTSPNGASPFVANGGEWSGITVSAQNLSFDTRGYPCNSAAPCNTHMTATVSVVLTDTASGDTRTIIIEPITGYVHAN